jgi:hypothetical protein
MMKTGRQKSVSRETEFEVDSKRPVYPALYIMRWLRLFLLPSGLSDFINPIL